MLFSLMGNLRDQGVSLIFITHFLDQVYAISDRITVLRNGELVCIFPEGKLTGDGEIDVFKGGVSRILEETPVPVIPLALQGLWGSFFSRDPAKGFFKRLWSRVTIVAGAAIPVEAAQPEVLREQVSRLRGHLR